MLNLVPHDKRCKTPAAVETPVVCVVDPRSDDYAVWRTLADADHVRLEFCRSAEDALRRAHGGGVDLWVVNAHLPGISGFDLCGMLKRQTHRAVVYLVTDEYSPEAELEAFRARATMYGCKGTHVDWLRQWAEGSTKTCASGGSLRTAHARLTES